MDGRAPSGLGLGWIGLIWVGIGWYGVDAREHSGHSRQQVKQARQVSQWKNETGRARRSGSCAVRYPWSRCVFAAKRCVGVRVASEEEEGDYNFRIVRGIRKG